MLYIMIPFVFTVLFAGWIINFQWKYCPKWVISWGLILFVSSCMVSLYIGNLLSFQNADYQIYMESYKLYPKEKDRYYTLVEDDQIQVLVKRNGVWEEKEFPKEKVVVEPALEKSELTIKTAYKLEPNFLEKLLFFKGYKAEERILQSVVICIPDIAQNKETLPEMHPFFKITGGNSRLLVSEMKALLSVHKFDEYL